jgi:hypothetical protein
MNLQSYISISRPTACQAFYNKKSYQQIELIFNESRRNFFAGREKLVWKNIRNSRQMILMTFACSSTYYFINSVEYQDTITKCVNWSL